MDTNVAALIAFCGLLCVWILVPLIPAWVTYKITPDQKLGLTGPLQGLTLRSSGAFAAYFAILIAVGVFAHKGLDLVGSMLSPTWTVKADVVIVDRKGQPTSPPPSFQALSVAFKPDIHRIGKDTVLLRLPGDAESWPLLLLQIPNFGGTEVDLTKQKQIDRMNINQFRKVIELKDPIVIREFPATQLGFGDAGR